MEERVGPSQNKAKKTTLMIEMWQKKYLKRNFILKKKFGTHGKVTVMKIIKIPKRNNLGASVSRICEGIVQVKGK